MKPTVILLAAGKSSRMWPLSDKVLFKYLGKTIIEHQFDNLVDAGLDDFILVGNKNNIENIKELLGKKKIKINYAVQEKSEDGIMGGIMAAREFIDLQKPIMIISSNDFVEKNIFKKVLDRAKNSPSEIFIVGKIVEKYFPGGYLEINNKNQIIKIVEKPKKGYEPSNMVNLVIQLFKNPKDLFDNYNNISNKNDDAHEKALQTLFDKKKSAEVVEYDGFWQALKYPWHHLLLTNYFLSKLKTKFIHQEATISKNAVINGNVYISKNVKVYDYAIINGPAYIGENSIIGNHVLIRNSIIGENCVIGHTTEVCRSYLSDYVWTHQNFIGDSILDENVSLGAGTKTGNLRLDEGVISILIKDQKIDTGLNKIGSVIGPNVRIGINNSIMPGVKIGSGSFIGAGCVVEKDIKDNSFNKANFNMTSKENTKQVIKRSSKI